MLHVAGGPGDAVVVWRGRAPDAVVLCGQGGPRVGPAHAATSPCCLPRVSQASGICRPPPCAATGTVGKRVACAITQLTSVCKRRMRLRTPGAEGTHETCSRSPYEALPVAASRRGPGVADTGHAAACRAGRQAGRQAPGLLDRL